MSASNCNCLGLQEFSQPMNIFAKEQKGHTKAQEKEEDEEKKT